MARVECCIQGGEETAKTITQKRDLSDCLPLLNGPVGIGQVAVHIRVKASPAIAACRRNPVNEIDFDPLLGESFHDASARQQIQDKRSLDE